MDVCFVIPGIGKKAYQKLANVYSAIEPPTWALLLAQTLRAQKYESIILDFEADRKSLDEATKDIHNTKSKLVVFVLYGQNPNSGTTMMIGAAELAKKLRENYPEYKIAFVGSHVSALPQEVIKLDYVDFAFINEGVAGLSALLKTDLINNLSGVPGLMYKDAEGHPRKGGIAKIITNLDEELPGSAWDLVDLTKYRSHFWHSNFLHDLRTPFASMYTSLGCQFGCNFCMINIVNRTSYGTGVSAADSKGMRHWSPEFILKEFEKLWELGVRTLRLTDEMFFLNKKYYVPILEGLIKRGLKFNLWAYARVDTVRQDQLELFKKAGVNWLCLGIESANQEVRLEIDKGRFKKVNIREVVQQIKDAGISVLGNFIFGLPEDNFYTMNETLTLALELNCEHTNFYCATALPGSPLYLQAKQYGWDLPEAYEEFAFLSYEHKPLQTKYLSAAQVLKFRDDAWHRVFNDPPFHQLVKNKFGQQALDNVKELSKIKLERKLLRG